MNQYVSVYQTDYVWPHVSGAGHYRHQPSVDEDTFCSCINARSLKGHTEPKGDFFDWSRMGPMGRLLDPKIYSTKIHSSPETYATHFDETNTFVKKLEEKCPLLHGTLNNSLPSKTIARVDADRLMTIYQVDYGDPGAYATSVTQHDKALTVSKMPKREMQCCMPIKIATTKTNYRPNCRPFLSRCDDKTKRQVYKQKNGPKCGKKRKEEEEKPPFKSEYQDNISKIGHNIMKAKLHHTKKKAVPTWAVSI